MSLLRIKHKPAKSNIRVVKLEWIPCTHRNIFSLSECDVDSGDQEEEEEDDSLLMRVAIFSGFVWLGDLQMKVFQFVLSDL